jgi:hypothetical protein
MQIQERYFFENNHFFFGNAAKNDCNDVRRNVTSSCDGLSALNTNLALNYCLVP